MRTLKVQSQQIASCFCDFTAHKYTRIHTNTYRTITTKLNMYKVQTEKQLLLTRLVAYAAKFQKEKINHLNFGIKKEKIEKLFVPSIHPFIHQTLFHTVFFFSFCDKFSCLFCSSSPLFTQTQFISSANKILAKYFGPF